MGEMVSYASNGGTSEGYLAKPESGAGPAVIVIQEWWGLVPHIKEIVERFASAGFVALAPDLYHGVQTTEPDDARRLLMGLAMDQAAKDIGGAANYLTTLPGVPERVATVGFCAGGSLAIWSATLSDKIVATVGFYPGFPWERMSPQWSNYGGKATLVHASEEDGTSSAPGIQQAKTAIETAGGKVTLHDYAGTHHAFFNDDRPEVYDDQAATLAWARTLEFLRSTIG
jgi:carboxymethylenebutenolidase